ncbi:MULTISPECIES: phosphocholine-specific phospholipase C [Paraburkholderia]|uniref:phosphocholine-specific phospholipase C n=1 Tax=Paraburkholderia TaxID=1822464 RepID=UPI00225915B3|nr:MULTISPECIES: phospholipase C, phosphocholine-specific [Paraburkholderia]MCX4163554.1 phospholipase C, phosphocholine-specific [Paraburkholderia megapolitana]MDN7159049.1 phospholipase C, phosphocholine-specific [Paraburkholderia sp. CHISQ3]MDQ6496096.1 phospholipase C, phosphocholine-specific [Paraburkholderia megapolitana]
MTSYDRRDFLKLSAQTAGAAALLSVFPPSIRNALAVSPNRVTGTIQDVEHVVILMQENRSFDHYFGTLAGVRGFGDPRPAPLSTGKPVWYQPDPSNADNYVLPFHFDVNGTSALETSTSNAWKGSQLAWQNWDAWIAQKTSMTMGYFNRGDLPFYYALADAFTVCDEYHASFFGNTNPNRTYFWSGTCTDSAVLPTSTVGLIDVSDIRYDDNSQIAQMPNWQTYAEVLQQAGVSWKLYQELDNFADNGLQFFKQFRVDSNGKVLSADTPDPVSRALYLNGRTFIDQPFGDDANHSNGDALVQALHKDVQADTLPQVSWIVPPQWVSEHPANTPGAGGDFVARVLTALSSNPEVWSKTVFILNYDEIDGFFDHIPAPIAPVSIAGQNYGAATMTDFGPDEIWLGQPTGLGPRVPMHVISPWSTGGKVCSELFDHTSVLRFLETWLIAKGKSATDVQCKNISPWRRAICGDLTSAFDFAGSPASWPNNLPSSVTHLDTYLMPAPTVPSSQALPTWETQQRTARPLPYKLLVNGAVHGGKGLELTCANNGPAGIALIAYTNPGTASQRPFHYTIEAGKTLRTIPQSTGAYACSVYGPNGFLVQFAGVIPADRTEANALPSVGFTQNASSFDNVVLAFTNPSTKPVTFNLTESYGNTTQSLIVAAGTSKTFTVSIEGHDHWYDVTVSCDIGSRFIWRYAGHLETGLESRTDPKMTNASSASGNPDAQINIGQDLTQTGDAVKTGGETVVNGVTTVVVETGLTVAGVLSEAFSPIASAAQNLFSGSGTGIALLTAVVAAPLALLAGVPAIAKTALQSVGVAISSIGSAVGNVVQSTAKLVADTVTTMTKTIASWFSWL